MKNQSNQNDEKTPSAKPVKGKAVEEDVVGKVTQDAEDQSASDKPVPAEATTVTEKDSPKATGKAAQKKPETRVEKKPPNTPKKTTAAAGKKEKKPPEATVKTVDVAGMEEESAKGKIREEKQEEKKEKKGSSTGLSIVALVLAILTALGAYYLYLQGRQQNLQEQQQNAALLERLGELQSRIDGNRSSIDANQQQLRRLSQLETLKQEIGAIRSEVDNAIAVRQRIEAEQQALNTALKEMSTTLGRTTLAWRLAEIEYLLIVANTRLTLERDHRTALAVLQTVDQKLRAIGDPAFVPVRQSIANEITALKAMVAPDITGLALTLASLVGRVEDLPLRDAPHVRTAGSVVGNGEENTQPLDWANIPGAIWRDIRGLVVVRREDKPIEPLRAPEEAWYLRQNLQLKLEQARLSLLRHETALFHQLLDEATHWLKAKFDEESAAVQGMLESLQNLQQADLQPSLPDISDSLRVLRQDMQGLGIEVEAAQREGGEQ